ncbi:Chloroperoxidase [Mycena vitilis]|nr:Chloroperoxidase [Mycena vitilis]
MKAFSSLLLAIFSSCIAVNAVDIQDGQTGVLMVIPPRQTDTGTKRIPDADHPFIAPGPNDMRGPCPGLNTLANHGGITSFEEIINGAQEAYNIDRDMGVGMASLNLLQRGNAFVNKISIGGVSPHVPPLPGQIDGPQTRGIAAHGRGEGDASMTRSDVHIGDNRNFNQTLWDEDLQVLAQLGDDGPDGPKTVFNLETLIALKKQNLESDQVLDPEHRETDDADPQFAASVFANGTTGLATKRIISSFFMNQTFPDNWHRAAVPILGGSVPGEIMAALPQWVPGHNDENGVFVADPKAPAPFNVSTGCSAYWDNFHNAVPATLATEPKGIFKQNVEMLRSLLFNASGCAEEAIPAGPTNV